jgi:hypothetical protein
VPAYTGSSVMKDDRTGILYAGHMGIAAVLVNVLIDKGIISQSELRKTLSKRMRRRADVQVGAGSQSSLKTYSLIWAVLRNRRAGQQNGRAL